MTAPSSEREKLLSELDLMVEHGWPGSWRATIKLAAAELRTQTARIAKLEATVEGLEQDAMRYRFMKKTSGDVFSLFGGRCNWDQSIDAALAPPQPTNREGEGL